MEKSHNLLSPSALLLLLQPILLFFSISAADPDPFQDFCVASSDRSAGTTVKGFLCKPDSTVTSDDFFSAALAAPLSTANPIRASASFADALTFPGLNTLGISMGRVEYAPGGIGPPHTHPRATELFLVTEGRLLVGFVATDGRYFSKELGPGEAYVFPRGLMHFQYNAGTVKVVAIVAFNSQLPGTVFAARTLFGSTPAIPDVVLAKAFAVDEKVVEEIKSKFG
ncbi:hypothetical protein HPP92_013756 [Vanilla planifolia]|uniref:Germin-like protein n=1 Tax=Vanilla planifolia TaxID=51239 RepID=A0A835PCV2_VANPL|nr:hypothetical protein HPP92_026477 [Vanilla planifolia]KAG0477378.1 hypothetical protein HPP92_014219 [Vanilla planifolia]KAG0479037.1 hypothetical protein HPP92_013756 [Vanilla planifolia]